MLKAKPQNLNLQKITRKDTLNKGININGKRD